MSLEYQNKWFNVIIVIQHVLAEKVESHRRVINSTRVINPTKRPRKDKIIIIKDEQEENFITLLFFISISSITMLDRRKQRKLRNQI